MIENQLKMNRNIIIALIGVSICSIFIRIFGFQVYEVWRWPFAFEGYVLMIGIIALVTSKNIVDPTEKRNIMRKYLIFMAIVATFVSGASMILSSPIDDILYTGSFVIYTFYFIVVYLTYLLSSILYKVSLFGREIASPKQRYWLYVFTRIAWVFGFCFSFFFIGTIARIIGYQYFELYDIFNISIYCFILITFFLSIQAILEKSLYDIAHPTPEKKVYFLHPSIFWIVVVRMILLILTYIDSVSSRFLTNHIWIYISHQMDFTEDSLIRLVTILLNAMIFILVLASLSKNPNNNTFIIISYVIGSAFAFGNQFIQFYMTLISYSGPFIEIYVVIIQVTTFFYILIYIVLFLIFLGEKLKGFGFFIAYIAVVIINRILIFALNQSLISTSQYPTYALVFQFISMFLILGIYYQLTHQLIANPISKQKQEPVN